MSGKGLPGRPGHRLRAARPAGHHHQRVPAAGHLPAGARGRALQHPRGARRRQPGRRAPRAAQGRGLRRPTRPSRPRRCCSTWRRARTLSGEQIQAVTHLVSSSVQDMDPDQVTVADSTGHVLSAPGTGVTAGAGDARSQVEQEYEARLAANAQQILDTRRRPGPRQVSVRADVDLRQRQSTSETYTYTATTPRRCRRAPPRETYNGSGTPGRRRPRPGEHARRGGQRRRQRLNYDKTSTTDNNAVGQDDRDHRGRARARSTGSPSRW